MGTQTTAATPSMYGAPPGWGVTQARVDDAVRRIVEAYDPLRVVVFGSWARDEARNDSDLDLAVFLDDRSRVTPGQSLYGAVTGKEMDIDILSFDLARHERLKRSRNSVHWYIEHQGRVLYERAELDPMIQELLKTMEDDRSMLQFPSPTRIFGFHAQQAVEKLLKGLIAAHGATFEWTHNLDSLCKHLSSLGEQVPLDDNLAAALSPFGVEFRYGGDPRLPVSREEIVEEVETLRSFVLRRIQELTPKP